MVINTTMFNNSNLSSLISNINRRMKDIRISGSIITQVSYTATFLILCIWHKIVSQIFAYQTTKTHKSEERKQVSKRQWQEMAIADPFFNPKIQKFHLFFELVSKTTGFTTKPSSKGRIFTSFSVWAQCESKCMSVVCEAEIRRWWWWCIMVSCKSSLWVSILVVSVERVRGRHTRHILHHHRDDDEKGSRKG